METLPGEKFSQQPPPLLSLCLSGVFARKSFKFKMLFLRNPDAERLLQNNAANAIFNVCL